MDIDSAEDTNDDTIVMVPGVAAATTPGSGTAGSTYAATNASTITVEVQPVGGQPNAHLATDGSHERY